jgi:cytidylate kinase
VSVYPKEIGIRLQKSFFDINKIERLKESLPKNSIIRVYGLAGVGKGTLSYSLSDILELPNIESSFILRCATYIYKKLDLETSRQNTDLVFDKMITKIKNKALNFEFKDQEITAKDLKTAFIDKFVPIYAQDLYIREKFDDTLDFITQSMSEPFIADGRGAFEPYLVKAEQRGQLVIRILLDSDDEIKAKRYINGLLTKQNKSSFSKEEEGEILAEFKKTIVLRNQRDVQNIIEKKLGLISDDTGFIDTTQMNPEEVLKTALSFIESKIG